MDINSNRQNQALVILTIGTAILGVGIFQVDFSIGDPISSFREYLRSGTNYSVADYLAILKLVPVGVVVVHYFAMFRHVMRIMRQTGYVTGSQLTNGPLYNLGVEIWFLMVIFVIDVFQKSANVS